MYRQLSIMLLCLGASTCSLAGSTRIAVAANFTAPMEAITHAFEEQTGHTVSVSFGSSGKLFAQVQNGAPFDAFLSADTAKPEALVNAGLAIKESRFTYAVGTLALYGGDSTDAKRLLESGDYNKLAIANPRLAPYGAAAMETLQALGVADSAASKLVTGENISQTWQFVFTGNADIGFIALSQIIKGGTPPTGAWVVPGQLHSPIHQDAVLLERGKDNPASQSLLDFLKGDTAREIIQRYGYATVQP
ncbi:molybdate ABC transporter substrate-binding protein [Pseudomaricurvus sp. HS19]|nr:molybdate ABC transporter substrate-binding protein [Pseudomaricurvus sp. HS19]